MAEKTKKNGNTEEIVKNENAEETTASEQTVTENKVADKWIITLTKNKNFCGIGAGSIHFAHGRAETSNKTLADWFKGHDGYKVKKA